MIWRMLALWLGRVERWMLSVDALLRRRERGRQLLPELQLELLVVVDIPDADADAEDR